MRDQWKDHIREEQAVRSTPAQREGLRLGLLQRIADRLAYARELQYGGSLEQGCWSCCWVSYDRPCCEGTPHAHVERWIYPLCDQDTCHHWHHQTEVFLA